MFALGAEWVKERRVREDIFDERGRWKKVWREIMHKKYIEAAKTEGVPWTRENVCDFIYNCRVIDNGIPVFKTHYGGVPFIMDGKYYVLAVCWLGKNTPYGCSKWFVDVPEDVFERLRVMKGDWKWLAEKYCSEEVKEKIFLAPIIFRMV